MISEHSRVIIGRQLPRLGKVTQVALLGWDDQRREYVVPSASQRRLNLLAFVLISGHPILESCYLLQKLQRAKNQSGLSHFDLAILVLGWCEVLCISFCTLLAYFAWKHDAAFVSFLREVTRMSRRVRGTYKI